MSPFATDWRRRSGRCGPQAASETRAAASERTRLRLWPGCQPVGPARPRNGRTVSDLAAASLSSSRRDVVGVRRRRQRRQLPKPDHCVSHALCDRRGVDSVTVTGQIMTAVRKRAGRAAVAGRCQPGGASGVTAVGVPAVYLAWTRRVPAEDLPGEPGGTGPARPDRPAASGEREPGRRQARAGSVRRHREVYRWSLAGP
jgi:hypothetical protein